MGNRLSKIYTRTGDDGTTGLGDGSRVPKDGARVEAYGCVDEANSAIGMILAVPGVPQDVARLLTRVQHELFDLGGELCIPGHRAIEPRTCGRSNRRSTPSTTACRRSRNSSCRAAGRRPRPVTSPAPSAGARNGAPGRLRARKPVRRRAAPVPQPPFGPAVRARARARAPRERQRSPLEARAPRRRRALQPRKPRRLPRASSSRAQTSAAPSAMRELGRARQVRPRAIHVAVRDRRQLPEPCPVRRRIAGVGGENHLGRAHEDRLEVHRQRLRA